MKSILWRFAGVDPEEVKDWKRTQQLKYTVYGAFIALCGSMAGASGFLAFYTIFDSFFGSLLFSLFFGLVIFNLYRFIIVNIGYRLGMGKNKREQFLSALPRLALAGILGLVIAKPLEISIFSPVIQEHAAHYQKHLLNQQKQLIDEQYAQIDILQSRLDGIQLQIQEKSKQLDATQQQLNEATDEELKQLLNTKSQTLATELQSLKTNTKEEIQSLWTEIQQLQSEKQAAIERASQGVKNSFSILHQLTVLHDYFPKTWFFTMLIILFYGLPILGKIKFSKDDQALVYALNSRGEWMGRGLKMKHLQEQELSKAQTSETLSGEALEEAKKATPMGWVKTLLVAIIGIVALHLLHQRSLLTDALSLMMLTTAALAWLNIIERELAGLAMVFFLLLGSLSIFLLQTPYPQLGVILGILVMLVFGILLIGSVLPVMRVLYTLGLFCFLLIGMAYLTQAMLRKEGVLKETSPLPSVEHTDSLRVYSNPLDSGDYRLLISHLRSWEDLKHRSYDGRLEVFEDDYQKSQQFQKQLQPLRSTDDRAKYWHFLYGNYYKKDKKAIKRVVDAFDSLKDYRSLNSTELARAIVSCVQDIPYALILSDSCKNSEKAMESPDTPCQGNIPNGVNTPASFLYSLQGDCDTRTLFLYSVLSELGYKAAIFSNATQKHSMLGVNLPSVGKYKVMEGRKYYFWECTSKGWGLGVIPPKYNNLDEWEAVIY